MKTNFLILTIFFTTFSIAQNKSSYFVKDKNGFDFVLHIEQKDNKILGSTREEALYDYVNKFKFSLIKQASNLKYPEIIRFEVEKTGDKYLGKWNYLISEKEMSLHIINDSIFINLYNSSDKEVIKQYKGSKIDKDYKSKDYANISKKIIELTENNIYNQNVIKQKNWKEIRDKMFENAPKIEDDLELSTQFLIFNFLKKIDFTHFRITKNSNQIVDPRIDMKELDAKTCILDIDQFMGSRKKIDDAFANIFKNNYENLIIDLRGNGGGNLETSMALGSYLVTKKTIAGYFPNKNWYENNTEYPTIKQIDNFVSFSNGTLEEFYSQAKEKQGIVINVNPAEKTFNGNIFVLIDKATGSTAEVVTIMLKENNLAKIIGEKTAGALLSAKYFVIDEELNLFLPVNDYISPNGFRVDKIGIEPDIEIKSKDALEYIMTNIKKL